MENKKEINRDRQVEVAYVHVFYLSWAGSCGVVIAPPTWANTDMLTYNKMNFKLSLCPDTMVSACFVENIWMDEGGKKAYLSYLYGRYMHRSVCDDYDDEEWFCLKYPRIGIS